MIRNRPILIAGAGIAGLTTALALARDGHAVRVFERAPHLTEVGAGLQLSPNATRVLASVGVSGRLLAAATAPESVVLRRGQAMGKLTEVPLGARAEARWGAAYLVIHRADLHAALTTAARQQPLVEIVTGAKQPEMRSRIGQRFCVGGPRGQAGPSAPERRCYGRFCTSRLTAAPRLLSSAAAIS